MLRISVLGSPHIVLDGSTIFQNISNKGRALFYYLACERTIFTREEATALLWPDLPDRAARHNLRTVLSELRREAADHVTITNATVALKPANYWLDIGEFEQVLKVQHPPPAPAELQAACNLYHGEFLQGVSVRNAATYEEWMLLKRTEYQLLAVQGFTLLIEQYLAQQALDAAMLAISRLLTIDPWSEAGHRYQMLALAQRGERGAALAHYARLRQLLQDEFGMLPDVETVALDKRIREGKVATVRSPTASPLTIGASTEPASMLRSGTSPNPTTISTDSVQEAPFQGPFQLIGRESELLNIEETLCQTECRLLTVTGVSGVGKTHLLRAARQRFRQAIMQTRRTAAAGHWLPYGGLIFASCLAAEAEPALQRLTLNLQLLLALGVVHQPMPPLQQQVVDYLAEQPCLLILDNVRPSSVQRAYIDKLLKRTTKLRVLVASQEELNLPQEAILPLEGLPIPESDNQLRAQEVVQFFLQQRGREQKEWLADAEDLRNIGRLCRLLNGLPLAIELAASLAENIDLIQLIHRLNLEVTDKTQRLTNQLSIQILLEQLWPMLNEQEQQALMRLSLFPESCSLRSALELSMVPQAILDGLRVKNIIRWHGLTRRLFLPSQIRTYVAARRHETAWLEREAKARFCGYYANFASSTIVDALTTGAATSRAATNGATTSLSPTVARALIQEWHNLLLAWKWCGALSSNVTATRLRASMEQLFAWYGFQEDEIAL